jgi:hypothetical protein
VLGTGAGLVALLIDAEPATAAEVTGLGILGRDVLRVVDEWRSDTDGEGHRP